MGAHSRALRRRAARASVRRGPDQPDFVSFYRWHVPDPIMFTTDLRVTIQQIGAKFFPLGGEAKLAEYERTNPVAGEGWQLRRRSGRFLAWGIAERVDDYCATSYVYCRARKRCRGSTSTPRSPTSNAARGRPPIPRWRPISAVIGTP